MSKFFNGILKFCTQEARSGFARPVGIQRRAEHQRARRSSQFDRRRERAEGLTLDNGGHKATQLSYSRAEVS